MAHAMARLDLVWESKRQSFDRLVRLLTCKSCQAITSSLRPCLALKTTSHLNGRPYTAAGQVGGSMHTTTVLQAYQADLLKDLDQGQGLSGRQSQSHSAPCIWTSGLPNKLQLSLVVQSQRW